MNENSTSVIRSFPISVHVKIGGLATKLKFFESCSSNFVLKIFVHDQCIGKSFLIES